MLALAAILAVGIAVPAAADKTTRPDALQQPLTDGCQRSPAGLLTFSSPEWVYVYGGQPEVRELEGIAHGTSPAGEDLPENHLSYDIDSNIAPDPAYGYLLGGDPKAKNGNFALGGDGKPAEDTDRIHVEWESNVAPRWVWPTEGDRVRMWGPWVWDCGHWGEGISDPDYFLPGSGPMTKNPLRGEQTEIHPMQALFVTRARPIDSPYIERQTDAFISSNGTAAHGEAECTKRYPAAKVPPPLPPPPYDARWTACVLTTTHQVVNDRSYTFFVPAPRRPAPHAVLRYREVTRTADHGSPAEDIRVLRGGIQVTVHFRDRSPTSEMAYGRSFFVGWEGGQEGASHLRLDLQSIKVFHSLDPNPSDPQTSFPPGEYNVYVDAGGEWRLLNDYAPKLGAVNDGDSFRLDRTLDLFVQRGSPFRFFVRSRECDLPRMTPCAGTAEVSSGNDAPGDVVQLFPSATAALGSRVARPSTGDYELRYAVRRGPHVSPGGAGYVRGPCFDTFAPRSRLAAQPLRLSRTRRFMRVRGTASDRGCGNPRRRLRRTQVAFARVSGRRCRFARGGRFGALGSCRRPVWLRARGSRRWRATLRFRHRLPRGRYLVVVRSVDRAGNVEHRTSRRNRRVVRVR